MKYRYEMHQHTFPCSRCGQAEPIELVRKLKEQGIAGCVITDHFYHGNTGIDRNLSWEEFCRPYEENYLSAKAEGDRIGVDILFGLEEHIGEGKEILLYGITPEFMYMYPELRNGDLPMIYNRAREYGAVVIQAHPFRSRDYIQNPDKMLDSSLLDGYEIFNTANISADNIKARERFSHCGRILTAGSDCHISDFVGRSGIETDFRITSEKQLAQVLVSGNYNLFGI